MNISERFEATKRARAARLAAVMQAIGHAPAIEFRKAGSRIVYIVHPSTYLEFHGQFQISRFDDRGPSGHHTEPTLELAVASAIGAHPNPYWDSGDADYNPVLTNRPR